jgi:hypothetical protein
MWLCSDVVFFAWACTRLYSSPKGTFYLKVDGNLNGADRRRLLRREGKEANVQNHHQQPVQHQQAQQHQHQHSQHRALQTTQPEAARIGAHHRRNLLAEYALLRNKPAPPADMLKYFGLDGQKGGRLVLLVSLLVFCHASRKRKIGPFLI